jgi:membrane-associated protein
MSDLIKYLFDFILHIDRHLLEIVHDYQTWTYLILLVIVFCETGLVITPFLPGDSLLFAAGAIASMETHPLNIFYLIPMFIIAAFGGDNTNYFIGSVIGHRVYTKDYRLIKREYLEKTNKFYERHGGKTVIIARFIPIIRTFAPFVAGIGSMKYRRFYLFSILGNLIWVNTFCWAGYYFGNIPAVQRNFTLVIMAIIVISLMPPVIAFLRQKFGKP